MECGCLHGGVSENGRARNHLTLCQCTCTCTCTGVGACTRWPSECSAEECYNNNNNCMCRSIQTWYYDISVAWNNLISPNSITQNIGFQTTFWRMPCLNYLRLRNWRTGRVEVTRRSAAQFFNFRLTLQVGVVSTDQQEVGRERSLTLTLFFHHVHDFRNIIFNK